ncbi:hypothetical protein SAY86_009819 [Trapa natans]|uniref:Uncharacterized protein n=1 Tax=Trapa natans TaxID=22666 RepID=A0AAN7L0C9_TRANT|nr:hypothetical protein SAY86_009819 [Trapa natans]
MVMKEDWVISAMVDSSMVAELLMRLKEAHDFNTIQILSTSARKATAAKLPPPRWGFRRSRSRLAFRVETASSGKGGDLRRNSPTTPLSWGAGTASTSCTGDCYEESDLSACGSSRSKVCRANDSTSLLSRKFKRMKELATLNSIFKDERWENENMKRKRSGVQAPAVSSRMLLQVSDAYGEPDPVEKQYNSFILPDLNMVPCEDDHCS